MHGTIGTMKGCGIRPHDQPGEKCPVRRILAVIGFFLLVFGAASIGMGAAIVLVLAILGRVGLRGTRTLLSTTMTVTSKRTREDPVAEGLCWVKCPAIRKTTARGSPLRAMS